MARKPTLETNAAALKRWRTRLKRAVTEIDKLERQQKRLMSATIKRDLAEAKPADKRVEQAEPAHHDAQINKVVMATPDDLDIPEFLRRGQAAQKAADEVIAESIKAEQENRKKAKAKARIEKLKAKQRGDLKKMPVTGKAALDLIRNGA